jgi:hypothetical protein
MIGPENAEGWVKKWWQMWGSMFRTHSYMRLRTIVWRVAYACHCTALDRNQVTYIRNLMSRSRNCAQLVSYNTGTLVLCSTATTLVLYKTGTLVMHNTGTLLLHNTGTRVLCNTGALVLCNANVLRNTGTLVVHNTGTLVSNTGKLYNTGTRTVQ